jgi:hypothetical protein
MAASARVSVSAVKLAVSAASARASVLMRKRVAVVRQTLPQTVATQPVT